MRILSALFYSQGFILSLIRMLEPGSLAVHLKLFKRLIRCKWDSEECEAIEPINMLFNSTLNIEFVYVILEGIVKLSALSLTVEAEDALLLEDIEHEVSYSEDRQDVTLKVQEIEIDEFDAWEPGEGQQHIKAHLSRRLSFHPMGGKAPSTLKTSPSMRRRTVSRPSAQLIETDFSITFHSRELFCELLEANNINQSCLEMSLSPACNRQQVFNAGEGSGKSGSFFFFSHDKQFIIKTMKEAELKALKTMLPEYVSYLKRNPFSMLVKIYGAFTLKRPWMKAVTVILMENTM
mmetsp:Transcript_13980/g.19068  ORF Transcript_13980/g.19068 Transcript_13980/m.19068 type:complete len:292 (-) Transcript_13980:1034-1909(-)